MRPDRWLRLVWLCWALLAPAWAVAQAPQPVPALTGRVVDATATLDAAQQQALDAQLAAFERDKGTQIVVLLVPTTQPEDIAAYANRVANAWKIGRRDVGDGLLLVVAKNDRKMRIEVAKTLEGAVPDLAARQIIDEAMAPRFRQGDFAGGLGAAVQRLQERVGAESLPAPTSAAAAGGIDWIETAGVLFFVVFFAGTFVHAIARAILGRKLGALASGGAAAAMAQYMASALWMVAAAAAATLLVALLSGAGKASSGTRARGRGNGAGWGGFGGGSGGGWSSGSSSGGSGGFSSGGGGDFGGGGASGDW